MNFNTLLDDGFSLLKFSTPLAKLQNLIQEFLCFYPPDWHLHIHSQDEHHQLIVELGRHIARSKFLLELVNEHTQVLKELCGPDIDIQTVPDLRISRPSQHKDLVNWHRDTFYGCSPWQLNLWFPLFDLPSGAGLLVIPGSHRQPSRNVRNVSDSKHPSDMSDDEISKIDRSKIRLLTPPLGAGVLFFGCALHRAINPSEITRLTLDVRVRSAHIADAESRFYKPFCRGIIANCVSDFLA